MKRRLQPLISAGGISYEEYRRRRVCRKGLQGGQRALRHHAEIGTNHDTAIIFSECECTAAATYTMNRVKAAPLYVTMEHLEDGVARAIVANAGNANACAPSTSHGERPPHGKGSCSTAWRCGNRLAVASTGVIGQRLISRPSRSTSRSSQPRGHATPIRPAVPS